MMENQNNINKSIIYGNSYENRYGRFMPVCSSILERASISGILDYLKNSPHFKKYNRVAYAYRVDEMPVVFITEKKNTEAQYYQGQHSDETIEGSGEKLLHLLQKFNIRNVLIAVLIQQFNPLLPFETTNYRAIVENSRVLLDELYRRVVQFQERASQNPNDLLLSSDKVLKTKKVQIGEQLQLPKPKQEQIRDRPNYVNTGKSFKVSSSKKTDKNDGSQQMAFLWDRCQCMKQQFSNLGNSLNQKQLQQLKYFIMYDKNPLVNLVMNMFLIYLGITKQTLLNQFNFKTLKKLQLQILPRDKLKKIDQILKTNKNINVDTVMKINKGMGLLFSIIDIRVRFSKYVERITEILEKVQSRDNKVSSGDPLMKGISGTSNQLTKMVKIDSSI